MAGKTFNAQQAAIQSGKNVRTILLWIESGRLKATKSKKDWRIAESDLEAAIGTPALQTRVEHLEREVSELRRQLQSLLPSPRLFLVAPPTDVPPAEVPDTPATRSDIAHFLEAHGVQFHTARRWESMPLVPISALRYARNHLVRVGNKAGTSQLYRCGNPECPCQEVLADI